MLLNKTEFFLMNNPLRNIIQKHIEMRRIIQFSELPSSKTVLEIGCGTGNGSRLIKKSFHAKKIYAIDLVKRLLILQKERMQIILFYLK